MDVNHTGTEIDAELITFPEGASASPVDREVPAPSGKVAAHGWAWVWERVVDGVLLLAALILLGGSAPDGLTLRDQRVTGVVAGQTFDLVGWEAGALWEKGVALVQQPAADVPPAQASALVVDYLDKAQRMGELDGEITRLLAADEEGAEAEIQRLQAEEESLRQIQAANRPAVEQIIQAQVGAELAAAGFAIGSVTLPPVQFTFTEPPKKMVVSPRDRIETVYSRMLRPGMSLPAIEEAEAAIRADEDLVAYITDIGGLGAYPTMVVDRASLAWVLNTVAHEWVHNYLTFFPLGFNYNTSPEITTLNETVADIVGDEIGHRVLRRYYPDQLPSTTQPPTQPPNHPPNQPPNQPPPFDFRAEMRTTRLEVDRLLGEGKVVQAELYMEARRLYFVENGYALRVLNQGYFAFHGSYATGAASISPIGPLLQKLRAQMPDLHAFLVAVRGVTSQAEVEALVK